MTTDSKSARFSALNLELCKPEIFAEIRNINSNTGIKNSDFLCLYYFLYNRKVLLTMTEGQ